jgi:hypothetical protein
MQKEKLIEAYKTLVLAGRRSLEEGVGVPVVPNNIRDDVQAAIENE